MACALLAACAAAAQGWVVVAPNATHCDNREAFPCDGLGAWAQPECFRTCPEVHSDEVRGRLEARFAWEFVHADETIELVSNRVVSYLQDVERGEAPAPPTFHFVGRSGSGKTLAAQVLGWALSRRRAAAGAHGVGCGVVAIHMISYAKSPVHEAKHQIKTLLAQTFKKCRVGAVLLDDVGTVPELHEVVVAIVHRALLHPVFDGATLENAVVIMTSDFGVGRTADIASEVKRLDFHNDWKKEKLAIQRIAKRMEMDYTANTRLAETTWIVPFRPLRTTEEFLDLLRHYLLNRVACAYGIPVKFDDDELYLLIDDWLSEATAAARTDPGTGGVQPLGGHHTIATARELHESLVKNAIVPLLARELHRSKGQTGRRPRGGPVAVLRYTHVDSRPDETVKEGLRVELEHPDRTPSEL
eukprot:TRINITY_DN21089_c0_g1_i1.p1 TRINITY_DN21089_c0_g1~~TRINITY_DN21089_c0_g1_i1.p1  ORF type:complete len:436 (+),score=164.41 TRINITY_DN21089_c0_g1_i1:66-1310(+)